MKRKIISSIFILALTLGVVGCTDMLEVKPLDKTTSEDLLKTPAGLKTLMATLYNALPMEDFRYYPDDGGFNKSGWGGGMQSSYKSGMHTDESTASGGIGAGGVGFGNYWPYGNIREVNLFFESLETVKSQLSEKAYQELQAEAHFVRAYIYFGLAKRYGGVPLITDVLDREYVQGGTNENLYIQRSTEKATWDFILAECDLAIAGMAEKTNNVDGAYRATKWAAYALKSRIALHAASVAKYWNEAPLTGAAVTQKMVGGMTIAEANAYYAQCIAASKFLIENSGSALYKPTPASPAEAATNFTELFLTKNSEVIFAKAYLDGTIVNGQGHNWDNVYRPNQVGTGFHKAGRLSPTLNLVDMFEDYTDNGTGASSPIKTQETGSENYTPFSLTSGPIVNADMAQIKSMPFKKYSSLYEPFKNKDARLLASIIVPGSDFKGIQIIMQGGIIKTDGTFNVYSDGAETVGGKTYYAFGAEGTVGYSGFKSLNSADDANFSSTGFLARKYLNPEVAKGGENSSKTSFIDMRLAEVYLNYAEAVVESGATAENAKAAEYLNALRKRAGHSDNIALNLKNVLKERLVEMAFEGNRYWDLMRRREFHQVFPQGTSRKALIPMIDLRDGTPKYIFVRAHEIHDISANGRYVNPSSVYYNGIPNYSRDKLVGNPGQE